MAHRRTTPPVSAYARCDRRTRFHVAVRWRLGALDRMEPLVPEAGRILDLGCGHGLLALDLALTGPERQVHGVDRSATKIAEARVGADGAGVSDRVTFETVAPDWTPPAGAYDAVVIADMLYLMDPEAIGRTVGRALDALAPGGRVIIKEVADRPRWKHRVITLQERLAVQVLHITEGSTLTMRPLDTVLDVVGRRGLVPRVEAIGDGLPYPHTLVVVETPA